MTKYDEFLEMQAQDTDDCVLWPYSKTHNGYGQVWAGGKLRRTSRLSCEMAHGGAPDGHEAAHSCRNRHCFNPRHLRWATRSENASDQIKDGTEVRGQRHGMTKLTEDDVRMIRYQTLHRGTQQAVFVKHFGMSAGAISMIVSRKNWGHI